MPTPPEIEQATSIGYFGANLERYYLQPIIIGDTFEEKTTSIFLLGKLVFKLEHAVTFEDLDRCKS
jgi:hypothetical protein